MTIPPSDPNGFGTRPLPLFPRHNNDEGSDSQGREVTRKRERTPDSVMAQFQKRRQPRGIRENTGWSSSDDENIASVRERRYDLASESSISERIAAIKELIPSLNLSRVNTESPQTAAARREIKPLIEEINVIRLQIEKETSDPNGNGKIPPDRYKRYMERFDAEFSGFVKDLFDRIKECGVNYYRNQLQNAEPDMKVIYEFEIENFEKPERPLKELEAILNISNIHRGTVCSADERNFYLFINAHFKRMQSRH